MSLTKAKALLLAEKYTCVLSDGEHTLTSTERGVKPLVDWLNARVCVNGFSAADKVVGRATAYLYVLLGVRELYAAVVSRPALEVLTAHGIAAEYGIVVDNIINRRGDGICPFESAVMDITEPTDALTAILEKMKELRKKA